ncbi:MAG: insulinase family protein [Planctomycetes bacterium]|nr:insulinase family protein [Planctomycetota bacterium]
MTPAGTSIRLDIAERELRNGLRIIAICNPGVPTFAATLSLRANRLDEGAGEHGLAYLVGACLEESTRHRTSVELAEAVEGLGASLDTHSSGGTVQCPAEEASRSLRLLREAVFEPAFVLREVRRVQQEIVAEIEDDDADPRALARRRFHREVYGRHPYARPSYATAEQILAYRPQDLKRFHQRLFAPREGVLAVAGPLPVDDGLELATRAFRSLRGEPPARREVPPPAHLDAPRDVHLPLRREQVHVYAGHVGVRRTDPDYIPLLVMDHVLGSGPGFTSRIARRLRDELGLCYTVYASITSSAGLEPGTFTAYIGTSKEHRAAAIEGFVAEMRRLRAEPPTEAELRDVHDYLTGSYVLGLERNASLVNYAIHVARFGLGLDYLECYPDLVRAVTRDDVRRVAEAHLAPEQMVVVSAGAG